MRTGLKFTNDGEYKRTKTGAIMNLNKTERAYRTCNTPTKANWKKAQ